MGRPVNLVLNDAWKYENVCHVLHFSTQLVNEENLASNAQS